MKIIGITGFSAAGKSLIVNYIHEKYTFPVIKTGDLVRKRLTDEKIPISSRACIELSNRFMEKQMSLGELAKERLYELKESKTKYIVIDALRGKYDLEFYKQFSEEIISIGIFSSPKIRFERMLGRSREGDCNNYNEFKRVDNWQFEFGVGRLFAFADYMIAAQDKTREEIYEEADKIIKNILSKDGKN